MNRKLTAAVSIVALTISMLAPATSLAQKHPRFDHIGLTKVDTSLLQVANPNRVEKVILELAGRPVALHQRDALGSGKKLSSADRAAIRAQLKATQDKLVVKIRELGGKVLGQYQDAYNGIKIQAAVRQLAKLSTLPGVVAIHKVATYRPDNTVGVPFIGAPSAWQDYGFTGTGVKIGIIDTGIDYYHANFGGSGNPADFAADDGLTIGTAAFPNAKVAGGYDFVGDSYNADPSSGSYQPVPHPDPDPLDCAGHGSHVAGTAAGFGVLSTGATYAGAYNAATISGNSWNIGPGVAPTAMLYGYRVFGCAGSTDVVVDAINQAVIDGMDVINMSLGSPFGSADNPDAVATDNASLAGVTVVASAGNSGPSAFITGSPASASRAISVAALDAQASFPGASIDVGAGLSGINANNGPLPVGPANVHVLLADSTHIALGCSAGDYASVVPGEIVVTKRGTCARVDRATFGQAAGASAVIMVNNASDLPPFEGTIPGVTIPFIGLSSSTEAAMIAANGTSHTIVAAAISNPSYKKVASFSSGGPRDYDNALKPDVTAPGVSVLSTFVGSGTGGERLSGTSMASPHTAGVAALVVQAHPTWTPEQIKAAIMNTADASSAHILSYNVRTAGSGVVQPRRAVDTVAYATTGGGTSSLSFGYEPHNGAYTETLAVTLWNTSASAITYTFANRFNGNSFGAVVSFSPSSVKVPAHGSKAVNVKMSVSNASMTGLPSVDAVSRGSLLTIRGAIIATPTVGGTGRYALRVPYLVAPRGLSGVTAGSLSSYGLAGDVASASVPLSNSGIHDGTADVYAWGLSDPNDGLQRNDIRAVGVQTFPDGGGDAFMVFAVNTWGRWGSPSLNEYDIAIDSDQNGSTDYYVIGFDAGALTTGSFNGILWSFTFDASFNLINIWGTSAPSNGSTVLLPVLASDIGLTGGNSAFDYSADIFNQFTGEIDLVADAGHFDSLAPAISQGDYLGLGRGSTPSFPVWVNKTGFVANPALGWMIVTMDDANGAAQADLVPVGSLP